MNYLAFDLGTKTGWCYQINSFVGSGVFVMTPKPKDGYGKRFLAFCALLNDRLNTVRPDVVFFEDVRRHEGTQAAHVYGGFKAYLCANCEARSIPCYGLDVGKIKIFATGNVRASKAEMVAAAKKQGWIPTSNGKLTEDEADAYWILKYGIETKGNMT